MRKVGRLIKRLSALFLVLIFCIESFGAVIDDYDGSAFTRKDEFEELKANFDKQIDDYNKSIDRKIDGYLANYLNGLNLTYNPTNLYNSVKNSINGNLRFLNNFSTEWGDGTTTDTAEVSTIHQRTYAYGKKLDILKWNDVVVAGEVYNKSLTQWSWDMQAYINEEYTMQELNDFDAYVHEGNSGYTSFGKIAFIPQYASIFNNFVWWVGLYGPDNPTESTLYEQTGTGSWIGLVCLNKNTGLYKSGSTTYKYVWRWYYNSRAAHLVMYQNVNGGAQKDFTLNEGGESGTQYKGAYATSMSGWWSKFGDDSLTAAMVACQSKNKPFAILRETIGNRTNKYLAIYVSPEAVGYTTYRVKAQWITDIPATWVSKGKNSVLASSTGSQSGSGSGWRYRNLPNGNKTLVEFDSSLYPSLTINYKYHSYNDKSSSSASTGSYSDTGTRSQTLNNNPTIGLTSGGTEYSPMAENNGGYWQQLLSLVAAASPVDFETAQWGDDLSGNLVMVPEKGYTFARNGTMSTSITTGPEISWSDDGYSHTATAASNSTYTMKLNRESIAKTTFENSYLSSVAGETVRLGGGCPIAKINSPVESTLTLKFNVKNKANAGSNVSGAVINYKISNKQFNAGAVATGADNIASGTATTDSSGNATVVINLPSFNEGTTIWLTSYAAVKPYVVELTSVEAKNS